MTAFAAAVVVAAALHYEVKVSGDARDLAIEARIAPFPDREGELSVSGGAEEFVREVAILSPEGEVRLERRKDSWFAPGCAARGCRIRYRFALREAAEVRDDDDVAAVYGDVVESPPGSWLLRPMRAPEKATAELNVSTPYLRFVAGLPSGPISALASASISCRVYCGSAHRCR